MKEDVEAMDEPQEGMPDVLARFKHLESELEKLGVSPQNFEQMRSLVEAYSDLQEELIAQRKKQFYDTAWLFCAKMKIAQGKHVNALAVFLRLCARQWVRETLEIVGVKKANVDEIVDRLTNIPEEMEAYVDASDRG